MQSNNQNNGETRLSFLGEEALADRKDAITHNRVSYNQYVSPIADRYLEKLQEYGIYCKEEKMKDWLRVTCGLVNSIGSIQDSDWLEEASLFEKTCSMMEKIHGNADWQEISRECDLLTCYEVEAVGELLLEFSPNGIAFVENFSKNFHADFSEMYRLKEVYGAAKRKSYQERYARM